MNNTIFTFPKPENEPVLGYKPGSPERKEIRKALDELYKKTTTICPIIGGKEVKTAEMGEIVMPTENKHVLAKYWRERGEGSHRRRHEGSRGVGQHALD